MGIKGLLQFLKKNEILPKICSGNRFKGKKIAIDSPSLFYRFYHVSRKLKTEDCWKTLIDNFIKKLKDSKLYFIKEGSCPAEKTKTIKTRVAASNKINEDLKNVTEKLAKDKTNPLLIEEYNKLYSLSNCDYKIMEKLLFDYIKDKENCTIIEKDEEAERTACRMCKTGEVDYVYSFDSDCFAYLCPNIILGNKGVKFNLYKIDEVLTGLSLSGEQFQSFCIIIGTDYNANVRGLGPSTAYKKMKGGEDIKVDNIDYLKTLFT